MSASKEFNKARAAFMRRASARELPASVLKLAYLIAFKHMDTDSEAAIVGQQTLADELDVDQRTVRRLLAQLVRFGLKVEIGSGRGHAARYRIEAIKADMDVRFSDPKGGHERRTLDAPKGGHSVHKKADSHVRPSNIRLSKVESPRGSKRALCPDDAPLGEGRKRRAREGSKPQAEPNREAETAEAFARFWALYPRQVEQADARAAFARAVKGGADVEAIVDRARLYAIERAAAIAGGDDPKWTLYPATWLKKKKWNDPPAVITDGNSPPIIIDNATGERIAVAPPRRSGKLTREQTIALVVGDMGHAKLR